MAPEFKVHNTPRGLTNQAITKFLVSFLKMAREDIKIDSVGIIYSYVNSDGERMIEGTHEIAPSGSHDDLLDAINLLEIELEKLDNE